MLFYSLQRDLWTKTKMYFWLFWDWIFYEAILIDLMSNSTSTKFETVCFDLFKSSEALEKQDLTLLLRAIYSLYKVPDSDPEIQFFTDLLFKASKEAKNSLSFAQFKESANAEPYLTKCFSLDCPKATRAINLQPFIKQKKEKASTLNLRSPPPKQSLVKSLANLLPNKNGWINSLYFFLFMWF